MLKYNHKYQHDNPKTEHVRILKTDFRKSNLCNKDLDCRPLS